MMRRRITTHFSLLLLVAVAFAPSAAQAPAATTGATALAPGVSYQHIRTVSPAGEPWSIHVLHVRRDAGGLRVVAAVGSTPEGRMARVLPSELGRNAAGPGEEALAVVNGDYDLGAPYLGISDGLSVTSSRLWTTGKDYWPALALVGSKREPVIAIPETRIELRAGRRRWTVGALNKPLGSGHGVHPRAFTPEYGPTLRGRTRFRGVVIGGLSPSLPLRVNRTVSGVITEVIADTAELNIPAGSIVIAERKDDTALATAISAKELKAGAKVKVDFRVRAGGKSDVREVIGGFPVLVRDGRSIEGKPSGYISQRHPRTAVCYNARELILVVVDGRQPKLSYGMTLEELADLMVSLGCTVAMNTDGGGSSVMAIAMPLPAPVDAKTTGTARVDDSVLNVTTTMRGPALTIVNSPSDGTERGRGNAWVVLRRK